MANKLNRTPSDLLAISTTNIKNVGDQINILSDRKTLYNNIRTILVSHTLNLLNITQLVNNTGAVTSEITSTLDSQLLSFLTNLSTHTDQELLNVVEYPNNVFTCVDFKYKLQGYRWMTRKNICILDGLSTDINARHFIIGLQKSIFLNSIDLAVLNSDPIQYNQDGSIIYEYNFDDFKTAIVNEMDKINTLTNIVDKNIRSIDTSIRYINNIVKQYNLFNLRRD